MGCDIHMVLEYRHPDGHWIGIDSFRYIGKRARTSVYIDGKSFNTSDSYTSWTARDRNYNVFAELAGVRGEGSVHREPQGRPPGISELAEMELENWGQDAHSVSWLPVVAYAERYLIGTGRQAELVTEKLEHKTDLVEQTIDELFGIELPGLGDRFKWVDKYRVVFWFDN